MSPARRAFDTRQRVEYWQRYARMPRWNERFRRYYRQQLIELYRFLIPPDARVLELGCAKGDLLAAVSPSHGVGVDFCSAMIEEARSRYPHLHFIQADVHEFEAGETFDYIILSDLINDLWDVRQVLEKARAFSGPSTRLLLNSYSRLWEMPRRFAEALGLVRPILLQNWMTADDITNLFYLTDFEPIRFTTEIIWPIQTPFLATFCNRYLARIWPFRWFGITNFLIARPVPVPASGPEPIVSVVVPARNESGNIAALFKRVPEMGGGTELIFVEGNSTDDTWPVIQREASTTTRQLVKVLQQPGKGKGDAVRAGFAQATGELLMILDADMTVAPEDLPQFYQAWRTGKGEFVNGVRLVYPMDSGAMRFFNFLGNKFFSLAFSWLLGQNIKDTLCGTKVLGRKQYDLIAANRSYFGDFDPFGDFDLIFGAARYTLRIVDIPIRYGERTYGETNIQRWRHGVLLLHMVLTAMRRIKFV